MLERQWETLKVGGGVCSNDDEKPWNWITKPKDRSMTVEQKWSKNWPLGNSSNKTVRWLNWTTITFTYLGIFNVVKCPWIMGMIHFPKMLKDFFFCFFRLCPLSERQTVLEVWPSGGQGPWGIPPLHWHGLLQLPCLQLSINLHHKRGWTIGNCYRLEDVSGTVYV